MELTVIENAGCSDELIDGMSTEDDCRRGLVSLSEAHMCLCRPVLPSSTQYHVPASICITGPLLYHHHQFIIINRVGTVSVVGIVG